MEKYPNNALKHCKNSRINNFKFRKQQYNKPLDILVEQKFGRYYRGFDQFYNKIYIKSINDLTNKWIRVEKYEVKVSEILQEFKLNKLNIVLIFLVILIVLLSIVYFRDDSVYI